MIKMGMIGYGARVNADTKRGSTSPFSVQANYVFGHSYLQTVTSGSTFKCQMGRSTGIGTNSVDRSPMPFGGKVLKIFVINHTTVTNEIGYVVPTINGVEQPAIRCDFTTTSEIDEEFKSPEGDELEFSATDEIGYVIKSTSGQLDYNHFSIYLVLGFDVS